MTVSTTVDERSGRPDIDQANNNPKPNFLKKKNTERTGRPVLRERGDPLYTEIPEWLQEFRGNLVDDEILEHGDSHASSSHEASF